MCTRRTCSPAVHPATVPPSIAMPVAVYVPPPELPPIWAADAVSVCCAAGNTRVPTSCMRRLRMQGSPVPGGSVLAMYQGPPSRAVVSATGRDTSTAVGAAVPPGDQLVTVSTPRSPSEGAAAATPTTTARRTHARMVHASGRRLCAAPCRLCSISPRWSAARLARPGAQPAWPTPARCPRIGACARTKHPVESRWAHACYAIGAARMTCGAHARARPDFNRDFEVSDFDVALGSNSTPGTNIPCPLGTIYDW